MTEQEVRRSNPLVTVFSVIVVLLVIGLSRAFPAPAMLIGIVWFSVLLGIAIVGRKAALESKKSAKSYNKEIIGNSIWIALMFAVLIFIIAANGGLEPRGATNSYIQTPSELAAKSVAQMKQSTTFPQALDDVTNVVDVTSSGNTVQYYYDIHDVDESAITTQLLFDNAKANNCSNEDVLAMFNAGVDFEYIYTVRESGGVYTTKLTKADCL